MANKGHKKNFTPIVSELCVVRLVCCGRLFFPLAIATGRTWQVHSLILKANAVLFVWKTFVPQQNTKSLIPVSKI